MCLTQIIMIPVHLMFYQEVQSCTNTMLNYNDRSKIIMQIIDYCVVTPFIFTLIFQNLIIRFMWKFFFKNKNSIAIVIPMFASALFFTFFHHLGFSTYIINNFIFGIILAYTYIVLYLSERKAILYTTCVHSIFYAIFIVLDMIIYFLYL